MYVLNTLEYIFIMRASVFHQRTDAFLFKPTEVYRFIKKIYK